MKNDEKIMLAVETASFLVSKECTQPVVFDRRADWEHRKDDFGKMVKDIYQLIADLGEGELD